MFEATLKALDVILINKTTLRFVFIACLGRNHLGPSEYYKLLGLLRFPEQRTDISIDS